MSAVARLLARLHGWLDPFEQDRAPATGEWLAKVAEPDPLEGVRRMAYLRKARVLFRTPRPGRLP